jgi:membrane protein YdbS with pleckstrin-like domain
MKRYQKSDLDYSILSSPFFFAACIIFLLITWFVVKLIRSNPKHKTNHLDNTQHELKKFKGKLISRNELDEILRISHLNPDSSKVLRSQRIKSINSRGETTISRIRDLEDKRMFIYKII